MVKSLPTFVYFRSFLIPITISIIQRKWCPWDLNPGPHNGRPRQNHGPMAAPLKTYTYLLTILIKTIIYQVKLFCKSGCLIRKFSSILNRVALSNKNWMVNKCKVGCEKIQLSVTKLNIQS